MRKITEVGESKVGMGLQSLEVVTLFQRDNLEAQKPWTGLA